MSDCMFCSIVAGQMGAAVLSHNERAVSFLDINPANPGHALIVPKRHAETLLELEAEEITDIMILTQRIARAVTEVTGVPAFNLLQSNGSAAGQVVDHAHFHMIPRHAGDGIDLHGRQGQYEEGEMERLQEEIKQRL